MFKWYVFESKNYSGWIFGDEKSKMWTQILPQGKGKSHKEYFYNPIKQNQGHIKWLKSILVDSIPYYSIITFSERCTLKKISVYSRLVKVIKRDAVIQTVKGMEKESNCTMDREKIDLLYNKLYPYTQVSNDKKQHIENIKAHR